MRRCLASELESLNGYNEVSIDATLSLYRLSYLATLLAHMRLFACVYSGMDCQCRSLDELLSAVGRIAHMRSMTRVDAFCATLVRLQTNDESRGIYRDGLNHFAAQSLSHTFHKRKLSQHLHHQDRQAQVLDLTAAGCLHVSAS